MRRCAWAGSLLERAVKGQEHGNSLLGGDVRARASSTIPSRTQAAPRISQALGQSHGVLYHSSGPYAARVKPDCVRAARALAQTSIVLPGFEIERPLAAAAVLSATPPLLPPPPQTLVPAPATHKHPRTRPGESDQYALEASGSEETHAREKLPRPGTPPRHAAPADTPITPPSSAWAGAECNECLSAFRVFSRPPH